MKHEYIGAAVGAVGAALYTFVIWPLTFSSELEPSTPQNLSAPPGSEGAPCGLFSKKAPNAPEGTACAPELVCAGFKLLNGTCVSPAVLVEFDARIEAEKQKDTMRRTLMTLGGAVLGYFAGRNL